METLPKANVKELSVFKYLLLKFNKIYICVHKVQKLIEVLSRKVEGLDPLKP